MAKPTRTTTKDDAQRFKRYRQTLHLSTADLAEAMGLKNRHYIEKVERGSRPAQPWMWKLLEVWANPLCPVELRPKPSKIVLERELRRLKAGDQKQKGIQEPRPAETVQEYLDRLP